MLVSFNLPYQLKFSKIKVGQKLVFTDGIAEFLGHTIKFEQVNSIVTIITPDIVEPDIATTVEVNNETFKNEQKPEEPAATKVKKIKI